MKTDTLFTDPSLNLIDKNSYISICKEEVFVTLDMFHLISKLKLISFCFVVI